MPNNPLKDRDFWPILASAVSSFWAAKVEDQGSTILDRKVEEIDVAFMKGLQLKDMEFVLPAEDEENEQVRAKFLIKRKGAEEGLAFSNRPPGRGEMRGALLRQRLELLKAENENLTLYEALTNLCHENIKDSDLITYFTKGEAFYDHDAEAWLDPVYVNVTKELAHLLLQYKKAHPETTEEELIAYGKSKEVMEAAVRAAGQPQRDGLTLLEDTLRNPSENSKALGRVLLAIKTGELTVNGQVPDDAYPIGEYLSHGGRVNFDVSGLSPEEQQQFFAFITNNRATPRAFATHRAGGTDANGSPAEAKSGLLGAISDAFRALVGASKHSGINLAIGGKVPNWEGATDSFGNTPNESGEWGHMYLHQDTNIVMVGVEASLQANTM
ncbi:hypothetical protein [Legionella feeleii]|uniref:Uncharacterized protein n=1 Tax=Legionella feeleii TaxID=453 RepID=A0A0W0TLC4_9GAMM|nr:hypothetical protein [Legionella feeleii]KTC96415.1 hypothetical protein Lfee_2213 [Legionella feeleii]SPX61820.1 Uncharacterised protein [Legionella feeleii]